MHDDQVKVTQQQQQEVAKAARIVAGADALLICAGAGMGVDSGLPDFRGNEGFWRAYPALGRVRMPFAQIASPHNFQSDPALAWGFYGHRLRLYRDTVPHAGFGLLRQWAGQKPGGAFVFTSNVDGQFQKAGFDSGLIEECHGSLHHLQCSTPCKGDIWRADALHPVVDAGQCRWLGELPRCPDCGAVLRPNVLMFDDWHWLAARQQVQAANLQAWLASITTAGQRLAVVELGAGTAITTVRHLAERTRRALSGQGARLVRINPRAPGVGGPLDAGLALGARAALQAMDAHLRGADA